jgi:hypothetical protein
LCLFLCVLKKWGVDWIYLAQDRILWYIFVNTVMNVWVIYNADNFLTTWANISFPRSSLLHGVNSLIIFYLLFTHMRK